MKSATTTTPQVTTRRNSPSALQEQIATLKDAVALLALTLRQIFSRPWRWADILNAIVQIAIGSLPIILIATAFAGMVVTGEIAWHMNKGLQTVSMVPGVTAQFILRELGIAVPALLLVAKVGASITAEVGSMKVTEQIDALKLLRIDTVAYLVVPRFIASIVAGACLTLLASGVTLLFAMMVATSRYHFTVLEYLNSLQSFVGVADIFCALVKGMVYAAVIPIVSCAYGFRCRGGSEGVGTATTNSVVTSTIIVIILDFALTAAFSPFLK